MSDMPPSNRRLRGAKQISAVLPGSATRVVIDDHRIAQRVAQDLAHAADKLADLVLWTDASWTNKPRYAGYAVAMQRDGEWYAMTSCSTTSIRENDNSELEAIYRALVFAVQTARELNGLKSVFIFTDSQPCLIRILRRKIRSNVSMSFVDAAENGLRREVFKQIAMLESHRVKLELRWVPRDKLEGNRLADFAARQTKDNHENAVNRGAICLGCRGIRKPWKYARPGDPPIGHIRLREELKAKKDLMRARLEALMGEGSLN